MSGPSPYNALCEIFGHGWLTKDEVQQQPIKKPENKCNKIYSGKGHKRNNKKPLKIDNACQTQPLRDYSYNKVVVPSKRKIKKRNKEKYDSTKLNPNDNTKFPSTNKVHKKNPSSSIGIHLKTSHVNALYKTVSDIEKIFREERNLNLHSRKCLCNSCGALGVVTESMKHPVDFSDSSSGSDDESDDDDDDDDDSDDYDDDDYEYCRTAPRYNNFKKSWKIKYSDNESITYGAPTAEGYLRLILELEKMIKRVRSLERLTKKYNIPVAKKKVDMAFDMEARHLKDAPKKTNNRCLISTSSSEIDKRKCGLFSIPNVIKRRFSKKRCVQTKEETKNEMTKASAKLRSSNYKHKASDSFNRNTYAKVDKKFYSNCLDEKIQNFDLTLLNEDEICELMFHLKNKDLSNTNRMQRKTTVPSNIAETSRGFANQSPETQNHRSNQAHKSNHTPYKMETSPVGFRSITESQKSLRNDATFIRKSPNYFENNIETNENPRHLFDDFLNINNIIPAEERNEINSQRRRTVLRRGMNVSEESTNCYNVNSVDKPQNNTKHKLNLDTINRDKKEEKDNTDTSKDSSSHKSSNPPKNDWVNGILNTSVIEEKYSQEMKISENAIKAKIGKTVRYSKKNEYRYFRDSIIDINPPTRFYYKPIEIGESSGMSKNMYPTDRSGSDLSREREEYLMIDNIPIIKLSEKLLPVIKKSPEPQIRNYVNEDENIMKDAFNKLNSNMMNEGSTKRKIEIVKIPMNNNQFKYESEPHSLRSELRSQNGTSKAPLQPIKIQPEERVPEFLSTNMFKKPPIIEKIPDITFMDTRYSYKKDNEKQTSLQKSENKKISENENIHGKHNEETKDVQKIKANSEGKPSEIYDIRNKSSVKIKENKATQVTEIIEEIEKKLSSKKDNLKTKFIIQNVENKNVSSEKFNTRDKERTQKRITETKSSIRQINVEKKSQMSQVNKHLVKKKNSANNKENTGTQVTEVNGEKDNIIEEIHECPLTFIFNNYPSFDMKDNSKVKRKSILKTYKRATDETPLKLDKKNSVVINKLKKHDNTNIVQKISSSIIHDIFNQNTNNYDILTKVFKRQKPTVIKEKNKTKHSRIPIPISHKIKIDHVPNITNKPKTVSRIPLSLNKANNKANYKNKLNRNIPQKKSFNRNCNTVLFHCNVAKNTPTLKFTQKTEIGKLQDKIVTGKTNDKNCVTSKTVSTGKKCSNIPVLQTIHNKKQENKVSNRKTSSASLGKSNVIINSKKATKYTSSIIANKDLPLTYPQNIKLYPIFVPTSLSSNMRKQKENNEQLLVDVHILNNYLLQKETNERKIETESEDKAKELPVNSDILNIFSSEIEKNDQNLNTDSEDEANVHINSGISDSCNSERENLELEKNTSSSKISKLLPVDSDILSSYNSQIKRVKHKIDSDSTADIAKVFFADSDILNSYNSQIERVERKIISDSTDDEKNSNNLTTESIILPMDDSEKKSYCITPPYEIETYESSCTFSEGSSGAVFIYKSKCQLGTVKSIVDSEFETHISESVYTSTSNLNSPKKNKKWKWLRTFGSKIKSFISDHTPKSSTMGSLLLDTSCSESNETCNGKHLNKSVKEENIRKSSKIKLNKKPKASLSFTLTLKKKNSSIL